MILSDEQQIQVNRSLGALRGKPLHEIEAALEDLRAIGAGLRPYLNYLVRHQGHPSVVLYAGHVRDAWAVRLLRYVLEHVSDSKTAHQAWNQLRSMGELLKEWQAADFTPQLWERCRTQPAEIPARTDAAWAVIIQWHLIFNLVDADPAIRQEAQTEFSYIGGRATPGLLGVLAQDDVTLWIPALSLLRDIGDHRALDAVRRLQDHPDEAISKSAQAARVAIETRPVPQPPPASPRPAPQIPKENHPYQQLLSRLTVSGVFDADLERQVVLALHQITSADPDDKIAGWGVLNAKVNQIAPIILHYARGDSPLRQAAQSVVTTLNLKA